MTNSNRLTNEELAQIHERAEKAHYGVWRTWDDGLLITQDIPKLLAEIERLRTENKQLTSDRDFHKGYAERFSDDIPEYKTAIRNLDSLAESVRYKIGSQQDAEDVADEIIGIISDLERKAGEIV